MKQPFRYFRGEFNGYYLQALIACLNRSVQEILDELVYQTLHQWNLEDDVPIRSEDIINIAHIAGLDLIKLYGLIPYSSIYLTSGSEYNERGLFDIEEEVFRFIHLDHEEYQDDIVNEATSELRSSLVPHGAEPLGYLPQDVPLYTAAGEIIWENLLSSPPADGTPYSEFYGEKFLTLENLLTRNIFLSMDIFKLLLKCVQYIRRNGITLATFLYTAQLVGMGHIYDIDIIPHGKYYTVLFRTNNSVNISSVKQRLNVWESLCAWKFKLFHLEQLID